MNFIGLYIFFQKFYKEDLMKKLLLLGVLGFVFFTVQAQNSDRNSVKIILAKNNLNWDIDKRAIFEEDRIVTLDLDNKDISLTGITQLVPEIGNLTELRVLTLNDGGLVILPEEMFNCTKLVKLEIKNNNLITIPLGISKLIKLSELDLRNNELSQLPLDIGKLLSIYKIQLWGNNLTELPSDIGDLFTLKELYLNRNRLTILPENITKLSLDYFDISFNYLYKNTKNVDNWLKKHNTKYMDDQFKSNKSEYMFL